MTETVCQHTECVQDEPSRLLRFELRGTIQPVRRTFCRSHDPRQDDRIGELWELVTDDA